MINFNVSIFSVYIHKLIVSFCVFCIYMFLVGVYTLTYSFDLDLQDKLITDQANLFTGEQEQVLERLLLDIESEHKAQIAVVTLLSLDGEDPQQVAFDIADQNKI